MNVYPGTGNLDDDPLFVDAPGGDLRLTEGSPCVDAGDNSAPGLPAHDLDGIARIAQGTVDMGAFELPSHIPVLTTPTLLAMGLILPVAAIIVIAGQRTRRTRPA